LSAVLLAAGLVSAPAQAHPGGKAAKLPRSTGSPGAAKAAKAAKPPNYPTPVKRLDVESAPVGTGEARNATFLTFPVSDRVSLQVNVGSGDAVLRTTDLTLPGVNGGLVVGEDYNSLLISAAQDLRLGGFGLGWRTRSGSDVQLFPQSDGSVLYAGPDGDTGVFTSSGSGYSAPQEFRATLAKTSSGYTLTQHGSGEVTTFDSSGLPQTVKDRNGNTTTYTYSSGQLSKITSSAGASPANTATLTWGSAGFISSITQGSGSSARTVSYAYDGNDDLTQITDPAGLVVKFGYTTGHDLTSISNGTGADVVDLAYDDNNRVTSVSQHPDSATSDITRLQYPSSTETDIAAPTTDQTQPITSVPHTTYTLNSHDQVTKAVDPAGHTRSTSYTPLGDVASATNANGGTSTLTWGANGGESLTAAQSPMGATVKYAYGNANTTANPTAAYQPSTSTDAQNNTTAYAYDGPGNLTSAKNATAAEADVDHNSDGTPKTSTDPNNKSGGNSTSYGYTNHQLTSITPVTGSSLKSRTFTYDPLGRIATATDGAGNTVTYTYDNDDHVTSVSASDGSTVTTRYDGAGNPLQQVTSGPAGSDTTTWSWDGSNRMTSRTDSAGTGGVLGYGYDADGNLTTVTTPAGNTTYTYDSRNLLTGMTDPAGIYTAFSYDKDGHRTDAYFNTQPGNTTNWAVHQHWAYDTSDRINHITLDTRLKDAGMEVTTFDTSYCYTPYVSGKSCPTNSSTSDTSLTQWSEDNTPDGTTAIATYDHANRLTKDAGLNGHTYIYTYDSDGNRTSKVTDSRPTTHYAYNTANQITSGSAAYDGAGNQTTGDQTGGATNTYTYNAFDQMTGATPANGTPATYTYAGTTNNQPLTAGTRTYTWGHPDSTGQPWLQAYTSDGTTGYINRDGNGTPISLQAAGGDYYYATDNLGSVTSLIDTNGNTAVTYTYAPYGYPTTTLNQAAARTGTTSPQAKAAAQIATNNPIINAATPTDTYYHVQGFAGGIWDETTSLLKLGQRYLDTTTAAFTQQDTISQLGNPANGNRYAYATDNPTTYTDPTGQSGFDDIMSGLGLLGGTVLAAAALPELTLPLAVVAGVTMLAGGGLVFSGTYQCDTGSCF
jgi:RHS repeat-associated protein